MARIATTLVAVALALGTATAMPYEPETTGYCGKIAEPSYMYSVEKYPAGEGYAYPSKHFYVARKYGNGGYTAPKYPDKPAPYEPPKEDPPDKHYPKETYKEEKPYKPQETYKPEEPYTPEKTYKADDPYKPQETPTPEKPYKDEEPYKPDEPPQYGDPDKPKEEPKPEEPSEPKESPKFPQPSQPDIPYYEEPSYKEEPYHPTDPPPPSTPYKSKRTTHPTEYAQVVTFTGPLGHYGCQLSLTFPSSYPQNTSTTLNIYRLDYPLPSADKLSYADIKKMDGVGLWGTTAVAKPGKVVVNTNACPTREGEGVAYLFEVADWVTGDVEAGWENEIYADGFWKSVGVYMNYDC